MAITNSSQKWTVGEMVKVGFMRLRVIALEPNPGDYRPDIYHLQSDKGIKYTFMGYLALPDGAAELVFQVLSERHERGSLIVTTNLPFGEWTKVFPDPRLAKAVVDRLTHRAHIIDTGNESWRFRHGLERQGRKTSMTPRSEAAPAAIAAQALALRARPSRRQPRRAIQPGNQGNINTNNNRRQAGPLQAIAPGPVQAIVSRRQNRCRTCTRVSACSPPANTASS